MNRQIVVGFDGSPGSERAADLAAYEAAIRNIAVRVVHGFAWPYMHVAGSPYGPGPGDVALRAQAEKVLATGRDRVVERLGEIGAGHIEVTGEVVTGFPAATLIAESRFASAVVLGDRGLGGFTGLLLGSVAGQLVTHAHCPVLIARGRTDPSGDVVAGVDGSDAGVPAVEFAFQEAALRGCGVRPVMVWSHPIAHGPGDMLPLVYEPGVLEQESARILDRAVAVSRAAHPDVPVSPELIHGRTRRALIEQSRTARLVVVGRSGRSNIGEWVLGRVSSALLHHADCPVAVVPPPPVHR
jgi:nucleotide-binding universal stress UspA family protein